MIIYNSNGVPIIGLKVDDSSYSYREIMGDCKVHLEFSLTQHVELPIGAYVEFQGEKYELMSVADVTIQHNRDYEYKVTFEGPQARFSKYRIHNPADGRLVFEMTAKPSEHLAVIIANLTEREGSGSWTAGTCIDGPEKTLAYNHMKLNDALTQLANAYDTEWEVLNGAIHLNKVEYNSDSPLELGYGRNSGFKPGVGRSNYGETGQIERLYVQGSDRNISLKEYGNSTLLLPKGFAFKFDGEKFQYTLDGTVLTETGFDASKAVDMVTDARGYSVALANAPAACNEESLDLTDIYPKRVGEVTGVRYLYNQQYLTWAELSALDLSDDEWLKVQVDIIDADIPAALDYAECLMANDEPLTVIFQTGMLAGREFNATFVKAARTATVEGQTVEQRPANRFELVRANFNGIEMPNATFRPNASSSGPNDTYIVVNCYLPDAYICDKATFSGAEMDMLRQAAKFLFENKDIQLTFKGEVDDTYTKRNWLSVGGKLKLGGCVSFTHPQVQADPLVTRIVAIKQYINNPYSPEVTLSNESVKGGLSSRLAQLGGQQAHLQSQASSLERYTRRSFRDAKETMEMLANAMLENFGESISPITVQTMQMLVGDESLQFRFWTDRTCTTAVANPLSYNSATKKVTISACALQHMTLGISDIKPSSSRAVSEYLRWTMSSYESPVLADGTKRYYVYAKVDSANDGTDHLEGTFTMSETAIAMNSESGYYYFLLGILNSEREGDRSFAPLWGYTEVLPGQITTDVIRNAAGNSFWDLVNNVLNIGDKLKFNVGGNNELVLNGTLVQTGSGATSELTAWCGEYNPNRLYKKGDEVFYILPNGSVSSFVYINSTDTRGNLPTDTDYWQVRSKGETGSSGQGAYKSIVFKRSATQPAAPTLGDYNNPVPTSEGWSDGIPAGTELVWVSVRLFTSDGLSPQGNWTTPEKATSGDDSDFRFSSASSKPSDPSSSGGSLLTWTARTTVAWITLSQSSGSGDASLNYTVSENQSTASRTGSIIITDSEGNTKTITITQAGTSSSVDGVISPTAVSGISASGGSQALTISDPSGRGWSISTGTSWITLSAASGTGNATVYATFAANSSLGERTGAITFVSGSTTQTVTVQQAAASSTGVFGVSPSALVFTADTGIYDYQYFNIDGPSDMEWSLAAVKTGGDGAIREIDPMSGTGPARVRVSLEATWDIGYSGVITVSSSEGTATVNITQNDAA